jgi:hypothetical protein
LFVAFGEHSGNTNENRSVAEKKKKKSFISTMDYAAELCLGFLSCITNSEQCYVYHHLNNSQSEIQQNKQIWPHTEKPLSLSLCTIPVLCHIVPTSILLLVTFAMKFKRKKASNLS